MKPVIAKRCVECDTKLHISAIICGLCGANQNSTLALAEPPTPPALSMKFRKKPVVVDAWQNLDDNGWPQWLGEVDVGREPGGVILINTLEGVMRAEMGDWIIRGVAGEVYPCKPDIFEQTYEPLEE